MTNTAHMRKAPSSMVPCLPVHVEYLAARARPDEIEQYHALGCGGSIADYCNSRQGPKFTVLADGLPVAAGGYFLVGERTWQSWMLGTMDGWTHHWRSITKAVRWLLDAMLETCADRLETYVLSARTKAIEWYERSLFLVRDEGYDDPVASLYVRVA
jgi:hypothetical protein